jgi:superfamily II DNA or RNA helicase
MSADSCVAILETRMYPDSNKPVEYRVTWAHAIDNVYVNDQYLYQYFKRANIFESIEAALDYARILERTQGPSEYGIIRCVDMKDRTWDEIESGKLYGYDNGAASK